MNTTVTAQTDVKTEAGRKRVFALNDKLVFDSAVATMQSSCSGGAF